MAGEPENRPREAEDGDSNVSYRAAGPAKRGEKPPPSAAPTDPKAKKQPVRESDLAGKSERYGPTSGKL